MFAGRPHRDRHDRLLPADHHGLDAQPRAGRLRAAGDRPWPDADPSDLDPGHQHIGQSGAKHGSGARRRRDGACSSCGSSGWRRSSARIIGGGPIAGCRRRPAAPGHRGRTLWPDPARFGGLGAIGERPLAAIAPRAMAKIETPQPVRGTQSLLGEEADRFHEVVAAFDRVRRLYGFKRVEVPLIEPTAVFARTIGETTDVVSKEMYSFEDRSGDSITLRPEFTAGICRAYLSEGWQQFAPLKVATHGAGLPLRAAAERALPPVPPARRRDHRRRRAAGGCRDPGLRRAAAGRARHRTASR